MVPRIDPARPADEPAVRALLRAMPMPGTVLIGYEREPDFFAADVALGDPVETLVARGADGTAAGVGQRARRTVLLGGTPEAVAYLGGLRLAPELRASGAHAEAWRQMRRLHTASPVALTLSSITADNERARRLLTLGRGAVPRFEPLAEVETLALVAHRWTGRPVSSSIRCARSAPEARAALVPESPLDLFPVADPFRLPGLRPEHVLLAEASGEILGALAVWDARPVRQSVVRGYSGWMRAIRPLASVGLRVMGSQPLPRIGDAIASGLVAHAWAREPEVFGDLVRTALSQARQRRLGFVLVGLDRMDERLATMRRALHLAYPSTFYTVCWDGHAPRVHRPVHIELPQL